jgi:DNA-binding transcriptional LysR family regulator
LPRLSTCADQGNSKARIRNGRRTHPQGKAAHSAYRIGKVGSAHDGSIIAQADAARSVSREYQRKENAPLKIGLTSCVSANLLVSPLAEVARFVPGLQVDIVEEPYRLVEKIYEGEINAALIGGSYPLPERIDHWVLFEERLLVLADLTINWRSSSAFSRRDWPAPGLEREG